MKIPTLQDYLDARKPDPEPGLADFSKKIGQRIRKQRLAFQWRQQDLASKAEMSIQTIKAIENGKSISLSHFLKIMLVLGHGSEILSVLDKPNFKDFESVHRFDQIGSLEDEGLNPLSSKRVCVSKFKRS